MRDLRRFARQTNIRLIVGALLLVFILGDGLIYVIYGPGAAVMGFTCLLAGLAPILLILLALALIDWIVKRANRD
jgi:hypothetical protein